MLFAMKAVMISGAGSCEVQQQPDPRAVEEFAVIKIEVAPMCTEFKGFKDGRMHHPLGHEAAGEVMEVASPGTVEVGDRVVVMPQFPCGRCSLCLGGDYIHCQNTRNMKETLGSEWGIDTYAQYMVKQDWLLLPIPNGMSYEHAAMACCGLGPSFGGMDLAQVDAFDTVLVTGLGPVGLGAVINGGFRGARVIGVESSSYRAGLAKELGAEAVVNSEDPDALEQVFALTGGKGSDKAIECSGTGAAAEFCIKASRRKAHVSLVGGSAEITVHGWKNIISQGLTIHGAWHWNLSARDRIFQVIKASGHLIDKQITHTYPIDKVRDAWELQLTGDCGKVLLYPWE